MVESSLVGFKLASELGLDVAEGAVLSDGTLVGLDDGVAEGCSRATNPVTDKLSLLAPVSQTSASTI